MIAGASIGFKANADAGLRPEVPAKPMPIVVNTVQYFEDLDLVLTLGVLFRIKNRRNGFKPLNRVQGQGGGDIQTGGIRTGISRI